MDTYDLETYGWLAALLAMFIIPMILFMFFEIVTPSMEYKRSIAFYLGWIPSNMTSCWYLHYSIGFLDAFMIFVICQLTQAVFIYVMSVILVRMFGRKAFDIF